MRFTATALGIFLIQVFVLTAQHGLCGDAVDHPPGVVFIVQEDGRFQVCQLNVEAKTLAIWRDVFITEEQAPKRGGFANVVVYDRRERPDYSKGDNPWFTPPEAFHIYREPSFPMIIIDPPFVSVRTDEKLHVGFRLRSRFYSAGSIDIDEAEVPPETKHLGRDFVGTLVEISCPAHRKDELSALLAKHRRK